MSATIANPAEIPQSTSLVVNTVVCVVGCVETTVTVEVTVAVVVEIWVCVVGGGVVVCPAWAILIKTWEIGMK